MARGVDLVQVAFPTGVVVVAAFGSEHQQRVELLRVRGTFERQTSCFRGLQMTVEIERAGGERTITMRAACALRMSGDLLEFDVAVVHRTLRTTAIDQRLAIRSTTLNGEAQFFDQFPPDGVLEEEEEEEVNRQVFDDLLVGWHDSCEHAIEIPEWQQGEKEKHHLNENMNIRRNASVVSSPRSTTKIPPTFVTPNGLAIESFFSDGQVPLPFHHLL